MCSFRYSLTLEERKFESILESFSGFETETFGSVIRDINIANGEYQRDRIRSAIAKYSQEIL